MLWDFHDPEASAERFAAAAADESRPARHRAELATQHARALGLLGRFAEAHAVLDQVVARTGPDDVARVRVLLERGRLHRSAGTPRLAMPVLREAVRAAEGAGLTVLAVDALHMLALIHPAGAESWTVRALNHVRASSDPEVRRWAVALHTNLGWGLHDEGRLEEAFAHFEDAHRAALDRLHAPSAVPDVPDADAVETEQVARWAIARCLRSLGRTSEALAMQRRLLVERPDDPFVREEVKALGESPGARVTVEDEDGGSPDAHEHVPGTRADGGAG